MTTNDAGSEMIGLCHVGMYAKDPALLAEFYRDVMGVQVVGGSDASHPLGPSAFLSNRPRQCPIISPWRYGLLGSGSPGRTPSVGS